MTTRPGWRRTVAVAVLAGLGVGAAAAALLPFRASTVVRESGWFASPPGEMPEAAPPVRVEGDCGSPVAAAWPTERDQVRRFDEGAGPRYEAVDGRLGRSCDAPAARRLALSAGLLVPTGVLVAALAGRRRGRDRSPPVG